MSIFTLSRVKTVFGTVLAFLLMQFLIVSYYNETRRSYNLTKSRREYVPSIISKSKPHLKLSSIQNQVDEKTQANEVNYLKLCPQVPPILNETVSLLVPVHENLEEVAQRLSRLRLLEGGHQIPLDCQARYKVAIIVPYRNRLSNLCSFLLNIHPFLTKQQLDYTIFVVEQFSKPLTDKDDALFNRGMLLNVGFTEALKLYDFDCFVFHDVDLIPMNNRNFYSCSDQPRHMAVAVNKYNNRLPYPEYFGGVLSMSQTHFKLINGFSNIFWGWGGEDDDLWFRVMVNKLNITRYPPDVARYHSLSHAGQTTNFDRLEQLEFSWKRLKTDGLNNLEYQVKKQKKFPLFTYFLVDLADKRS